MGLTNSNDVNTDPQVIPPPVLNNASVLINSRFVGLIAGRGSGFTAGVACPGSSPERTRFAHFEVQSVGQHLQSNASSTQLQGFYVLAPQPQ